MLTESGLVCDRCARKIRTGSICKECAKRIKKGIRKGS